MSKATTALAAPMATATTTTRGCRRHRLTAPWDLACTTEAAAATPLAGTTAPPGCEPSTDRHSPHGPARARGVRLEDEALAEVSTASTADEPLAPATARALAGVLAALDDAMLDTGEANAHFARDSSVGLHEFVLRVLSVARVPWSAVYTALIYIRRLDLAGGVKLTQNNCYRIFLTSLLLAAKWVTDVPARQQTWVWINYYASRYKSDATPASLRELELEILDRLDFRLHVSARELAEMRDHAADALDASQGAGAGQAAIAAPAPAPARTRVRRKAAKARSVAPSAPKPAIKIPEEPAVNAANAAATTPRKRWSAVKKALSTSLDSLTGGLAAAMAS